MSVLGYILGGGLVLLGFGLGWFFRFGPGAKMGAVADAILGTPEVKDRRGGVLDPGHTGLVARMSEVEERFTGVEKALSQLADQQTAILALAERMDRAENTIASLVMASAERAATAASAAAVLNLIRDERTETIPED